MIIAWFRRLVQGAARSRRPQAKLLEAGLLKEIKAKAGAPIWRRDDETGLTYALKLTAAGAKAIAADETSPSEREGERARQQPLLALRCEAAGHPTPEDVFLNLAAFAAKTEPRIAQPPQLVHAKSVMGKAKCEPPQGEEFVWNRQEARK